MSSYPATEWQSPLFCYRTMLQQLSLSDVTANPAEAGFSGARVWKVSTHDAVYCLRRWPAPIPDRERLWELHRWLEHLSGEGNIPVAPAFRTDEGQRLLEQDGILWQLEPWRPGEPDRSEEPTSARLTSAMTTLASLHQCSASYCTREQRSSWFVVGHGPSPAVIERGRMLSGWTRRRLRTARDTLVHRRTNALGVTALRLVQAAIELRDCVLGELHDARSIHVPLLPCLRDVWRDHVLFTGERVTGLIDPAAARTDSTASDLSRFLGSYLPLGQDRWEEALGAYESVRALTESEHRLIPVLDRSNVLLSGLHWVRRIEAGELPQSTKRLADRLAWIADRLESFMRTD